MQPTTPRMSEMPGPKVYNLWWGDKSVQRQKGVVTYAVSPWRQRAAKNMFRSYIFNGYRRLSQQAPYWIIPFAIGYGTYTWARSHDEWQNSKAAHVAGGHHGEH
ncbi:UcrQ domain-containing protein [Phanerochaete sordida]|uniref:Cytochrome b-c1 complex subunit 8 n=1 Tax=Phanerochaete sordida TaxID=48140 RepID=A0A9P3G159_9APHY|nr:UcrQ domain-containing protein [Phanerochaete sordida]